MEEVVRHDLQTQANATKKNPQTYGERTEDCYIVGSKHQTFGKLEGTDTDKRVLGNETNQ